ncbi:MAG: hypothetical protein J0H40_17840 [Rhizobiales bacterium]|nr:hypothetical protein [Hyphomicrobiales bacterium]
METHEGVVEFRSAQTTSGREMIMLGRVQVGEISPSVDPRSRFPICFRLELPDASSRAWQPARDVADARRQVVGKINDWMIAAGLRPNGAA